MFINKFNVVVFFQNMKNVDIVFIFIFLWTSRIFFTRSIFLPEVFFPFNTFPTRFLPFQSMLNNFLHSSSYVHFWEVL